MKITFNRSGGFTGIPLEKTIDTKMLPSGKAKEIEDLVEKSDFPSLRLSPYKTKPDRFTYSISIQNDTISGNISIQEESLTPEMRKLITYLQNV